ncbi:glycosyltransferase family 2 protein [Yeosuana marina]|uniref:glycosyltransferase family 2 protein n=1 Tax=Yeosuana marina TaxID=1565536 RepID=UPI0030ED2ADD|tara:strand:+ start:763 stop:1767 length:1005 start_codon:yes stop_codon:yes gene_type:complete
MKLSIIIPLFNAEAYIYKCIESLLNQNISFDTYEIIVVNDGSTDKSEHIVRSFCEEYKNLILINQRNKGNGAARNRGVDAAKGEYLYFIDSDDYLASNVIFQLLNLADEYDLDMIGFDSQVTSSSNLDESKGKFIKTNLKPTNGIEFIKKNNYKAEVWWYFVKKSFYKRCGIKFYEKRFVQDSYITTTLLLKSNKILYVPIDAHRYRKHENSITKNTSRKHISKHINDMFFAIEELSHLSNQLEDKECLKRLKSRQESYFFFLLMRFPKSNLTFKNLSDLLKKGKNLHVYPLKNFISDDYNGWKYRVLTFLINRKIMLFFFMFIYRIKIIVFKN